MPQLLGREVGPIGFGLMGFTWREKPCSQEQAIETMHAALASGCNFWNGGEFYGPPEYNSLVLLERYLEKYPEDADKIVLSIKGGMNMKTHGPDGSQENTRRTIEDSNTQLRGRKKIDLFEHARRDPKVDMKVTFDTMNEYVSSGTIGGVSLSEVRLDTLHEAVKYTKVKAVEVELSLFSPDILHNGIAEACAKYNIPIVAYSPLGRGMLTGHFKSEDDLPSNLKQFPRFQGENFKLNLDLVQKVEEIAKAKGCTPGQLAINWIIAISKRPGMPTIIPIPGATTVERVKENSKLIDLTENEMKQLDEILSKFETAGGRYPEVSVTFHDVTARRCRGIGCPTPPSFVR